MSFHAISPRAARRERKLGREIALVLVLKLVLLAALKWLFFSQPVAPPEAAARVGALWGGPNAAIQTEIGENNNDQ